MKKILSIILSVLLLVSVLPVSAAEQAEEMQEVLLSVKERIMDTEKFEEFNSSVMNSNNDKFYNFDWSSNLDEKYKSLSITADANGIITNYRYYDDESNSFNNSPSLNKMSSDDALIKAQQLIDKLNPMLAGKIVAEKSNATESLFDNTYRFNLIRYENNIPVYNDNGFVTVNQDATQIIRYNVNYTNGLSFENSDNVINISDAWEYYYKKSGAELEYRIKYDDDNKKVYLAYIPQLGSNEYIDAKSGEVTPIWYRDYYYSGGSGGIMNMQASKDAAVEESARLTEIERDKIKEVEGLASSEDAENAIRNNSILDFESDLTLNSVNLYKEYNGERYFYDLGFESRHEEVYRYAYATLDAKTLELIRWRVRTKDYIDYNSAQERDITKEDVEENALKALEILAPKHLDEYRISKNGDASSTIGYTRFVNDIKFNNDYINIEVNPDNGKVWNFSINYTDIEFPSPEGIITEKEAINKLSEHSEMVLYYFPAANDEKAMKADVAKLGYKNTRSYEIDAFDGVAEDNAEQKVLAYCDISDHYAKKEIETLAKFGIGFEGSEFKPDDVITVNEYITLLVSTFSNYTPIVLKASNEITYEYKAAQRDGIIKADEVTPDEPLTRENAAVYMIRVMGLEEVAKLDFIYKPVFTDVTQNVGYISILGAMGVFNGDENGLFNPCKNLTRADAAIIIYNYLSR